LDNGEFAVRNSQGTDTPEMRLRDTQLDVELGGTREYEFKGGGLDIGDKFIAGWKNEGDSSNDPRSNTTADAYLVAYAEGIGKGYIPFYE